MCFWRKKIKWGKGQELWAMIKEKKAKTEANKADRKLKEPRTKGAI